MSKITRRDFVATASAALASAAVVGGRARAGDANSEVVLALMGANNRGSDLAGQFAKQKGCRKDGH